MERIGFAGLTDCLLKYYKILLTFVVEMYYHDTIYIILLWPLLSLMLQALPSPQNTLTNTDHCNAFGPWDRAPYK